MINTTIADNIISVLDYIFTKFGIVVDWTAETLTPYIQQAVEKYAAWQIARDTVGIWFGAILLGVAIIGCIGSIITAYRTDNELWYLWNTLWAIFFIAGIILLPMSILDLIKAMNFPELKFIEWVTELLNTVV